MTDQTVATEPETAPEPAPEPEVAPETTTEAAEAPEGTWPEEMDASLEKIEEQLDQPGVQPDPAEALPEQDTVEVEVNGLKYRVPAVLKDGYMKGADYTRKSQENADVARTLVSDREAFAQQVQNQQGHLQDLGELAHTDKLLEDFRKVDFQRLQQDDPDQAQQLGFQFQTLRDTRQQIVERIQQRDYTTRVQAERENANRKNQLTATLAREIPNYTPELHGQLDQIAVEVGFKPEEIAAYADARHYKILQLARIGADVLKRKRAATAQPAPKPVKPVPKVVGGRTPATGPSDKDSTEVWMQKREQQLSKRDTG